LGHLMAMAMAAAACRGNGAGGCGAGRTGHGHCPRHSVRYIGRRRLKRRAFVETREREMHWRWTERWSHGGKPKGLCRLAQVHIPLMASACTQHGAWSIVRTVDARPSRARSTKPQQLLYLRPVQKLRRFVISPEFF
jgi:hypothetical protein